MFPQFFIFCGLPKTVSLGFHYCAWGRVIKRPRTTSAATHQVSNTHKRDHVTNQNVEFRPFLGQTYLLKSIFSIHFASSWRFQPAVTGEFFVELRSIKVSHVLLCIWLVPSHLTCPLWTRNRWITVISVGYTNNEESKQLSLPDSSLGSTPFNDCQSIPWHIDRCSGIMHSIMLTGRMLPVTVGRVLHENLWTMRLL